VLGQQNDKFGPEVAYAIWFTFSTGIKRGAQWSDVLAKSKMAAIRLDVNHRYKT